MAGKMKKKGPQFNKRNILGSSWLPTCLQVSLGDAAVFSTLEFVALVVPDWKEKRENLCKLCTAFSAVPEVAQWLKERPQSDF